MRHENQARIGTATFHSQSKVFRKSSSTTENVRVLLRWEDWIRFEHFSPQNTVDFLQSITFPQRLNLARFTTNQS